MQLPMSQSVEHPEMIELHETKKQCANSELLTSPEIESKIFNDDDEYFASHFRVCALLHERGLLLKKLADFKDQHSVTARNNSKKIQARLAEINRGIREKRDQLSVSLVKSLEQGRKYYLEDLASQYGLDSFEKQIQVFFVYLKYFYPEKAYSQYELFDIMDLANSFKDRLVWGRYFRQDSALIKHKILTTTCYFDRSRDDRRFCLNPKITDIIAKVANKETVDASLLKINGEDEPSVSACSEVGFRKTPEYSFEQVALKDSMKEKILLFLDCVKNKGLENFGIEKTIKKGRGALFLFYGPPGTGKSILAEAIAAYVNKDVLVAEYSKILNSRVGETDKCISNLFKVAKNEDLVIVLDEADSLLYDRSYAQQEHDIRFVNGMLQELERFEGVAILTTNRASMLDPALERRISLKVELEPPDSALQSQIWKLHIPPMVTLSEDVCFDRLAEKYSFSGGNIKNAVLNALRKAASKNEKVLTMDHLHFGAKLESEGMFNSKKIGVVHGFQQKQKTA